MASYSEVLLTAVVWISPPTSNFCHTFPNEMKQTQTFDLCKKNLKLQQKPCVNKEILVQIWRRSWELNEENQWNRDDLCSKICAWLNFAWLRDRHQGHETCRQMLKNLSTCPKPEQFPIDGLSNFSLRDAASSVKACWTTDFWGVTTHVI